MSEIKDSFFYNYYDFFSKIYVYAHLKCILLDKSVQKNELIFLWAQVICYFFFSGLIMFKILLIIIYFYFFQFISIIKNLLLACKKTKGHLNFISNIKNAYNYIKNTCHKIYYYNFYNYNIVLVQIIICITYLFYVITNILFLFSVQDEIEDIEKSDYYICCHYLCNEFSILIELFCVTFYSSIKLFQQFIIALIFFVFFNCLNLISYFIVYLIEESSGAIKYEKHKNVVNIIYNFIFMVLFIDAFIKIFRYNNEGKIFNYLIYYLFNRGKFSNIN
jgi:hypothetical protein